MACGVPVVVSSHASLDEASGDAAVRADPDDPRAFAAAIERAIAGPRRLVGARARARAALLLARRRRDLPPRATRRLGDEGARGDRRRRPARAGSSSSCAASPERQGYWNLVAGGARAGRERRGGRAARAARGDGARVEGAGAAGGSCRTRCSTTLPRSAPATRRASRRSPCTRSAPRRRRAGSRRSTRSTSGTAGARSTRRSSSSSTSTRDAARGRAPPRGTAVKVGVDTSPLVQTRAGTARHVRGLLGALRGRPGLELELLSFGGPGRASSVVRDAVWYPVGLGAPRARARRPPLHDVPRADRRCAFRPCSRCTTSRSCAYPEAFPRWHRLYGRPAFARVLRAADAIVAVSEFTRGGDDRARRRSGRAHPRRPERRRRGLHARTARARRATTCSRSRRSSRGRTSPGRSRPRERPESSCASSARAAGAASTVAAGSARFPTRSSRRSTAARAASSTRRCTRASACPCSRRWRAGRPS